jgi:capsular exopolysaccharide synthesis family protein
MSEFFKALEQAERDRALGRQAPRPETALDEASAAVEAPAPTAIRRSPPASAPRVQKKPVLDMRPPVEVRAPEHDEAREGIDGHMVSLVTPASFEAEQYRTLRHMIEQRRASDRVSIIACTSPAGGDGKTITAINLAGALAQAPDTTVLLVDADLRRPRIALELTLGHDVGPGLVGAILDPTLTLADVVRHRPPFTLSILPAGSAMANPYELLTSPRFGALLESARAHYDYVVVDTPPVVSIPDCRAIAQCVDGFLVVVAAHRTPRKLVEEALNSIEATKIIGLVYNADDRPLSGYYHSRYYAQHRSSNGTKAAAWTRSVTRAGGSIWDRLRRLRGRRAR